MAGELGAWPVLCSLIGRRDRRRAGAAPRAARAGSFGWSAPIRPAAATSPIAAAASVRCWPRLTPSAPSRHEADELVAATTAAALESDVLAICNPYPGSAMPIDAYGALVANANAAGVRVIADLSSPRIEAAAAEEPELVKLNDWELAAYIEGPVDTPDRLLGAAQTASRPGRCERARDEGGGPRSRAARRRGLGARPPEVRGRVSRGLRRHDDGGDLCCARPREGAP